MGGTIGGYRVSAQPYSKLAPRLHCSGNLSYRDLGSTLQHHKLPSPGKHTPLLCCQLHYRWVAPSLPGLLPCDLDFLLADPDRVVCNDWCGRREIKFDFPDMTARADDSGYTSPTAAAARLLSDGRFCSFRNGIFFAVLSLRVVESHAHCRGR